MIAYCRKCGRSKWVETRQAARTFRTASCLADHRPTTFRQAQKVVNHYLSAMTERLNLSKLFNRDYGRAFRGETVRVKLPGRFDAPLS